MSTGRSAYICLGQLERYTTAKSQELKDGFKFAKQVGGAWQSRRTPHEERTVHAKTQSKETCHALRTYRQLAEAKSRKILHMRYTQDFFYIRYYKVTFLRFHLYLKEVALLGKGVSQHTVESLLQESILHLGPELCFGPP